MRKRSGNKNPNEKTRFKKGSKHHKARLTEVEIILIRDAYRKGICQNTLATIFQVTRSTISRVVNHKTWRE